MKSKGIKELVDNGKIIPIEFTETVKDLEIRYDGGMKAYIVKAIQENEDTIIFKTEERDFAEYNKSIERPVWMNNKSGQFELKWSELEQKITEFDFEIWEATNEETFNFKLLNEETYALYLQYKSEESNLSYVQWLENKVIELQS